MKNPNNTFYQWLLHDAPKFHKSAYCGRWLHALGQKIVTGTESDDEELNKKLPAKEDAAPGEDAAAAEDAAAFLEEALAAPKAVAGTSMSVASTAAAAADLTADALDDNDNRFVEEIWKQQNDPNVEHWRQSGSLTAATGSGTIVGLSHDGDINLHNGDTNLHNGSNKSPCCSRFELAMDDALKKNAILEQQVKHLRQQLHLSTQQNQANLAAMTLNSFREGGGGGCGSGGGGNAFL